MSAQRLYLSRSLIDREEPVVWELRYIAIAGDCPHAKTEFNQQGVNQQYRLGLEIGEEGIRWHRVPPGSQP